MAGQYLFPVLPSGNFYERVVFGNETSLEIEIPVEGESEIEREREGRCKWNGRTASEATPSEDVAPSEREGEMPNSALEGRFAKCARMEREPSEGERTLSIMTQESKDPAKLCLIRSRLGF